MHGRRSRWFKYAAYRTLIYLKAKKKYLFSKIPGYVWDLWIQVYELSQYFVLQDQPLVPCPSSIMKEWWRQEEKAAWKGHFKFESMLPITFSRSFKIGWIRLSQTLDAKISPSWNLLRSQLTSPRLTSYHNSVNVGAYIMGSLPPYIQLISAICACTKGHLPDWPLNPKQ